jgi:hypothetical protein
VIQARLQRVTFPALQGKSSDIRQIIPQTNTTNPQDDITAEMGIKQLFSIIKDECPDSFKEGEIKNQFGRKVAIVSLANFCTQTGENLLILLHRTRKPYDCIVYVLLY